MSTRCNVAIVGGEIKVMVYRHCDGWPTELGYDLDRIVKWLKEERIPVHPASVASWLILLGIDHRNFRAIGRNKETLVIEPSRFSVPDSEISPGLYRITHCIHTDIDYFYVVDTSNKCWRGYGSSSYRNEGRPGFHEILAWHKVRLNKGAPHPEGNSFSSETAKEFQDRIYDDFD